MYRGVVTKVTDASIFTDDGDHRHQELLESPTDSFAEMDYLQAHLQNQPYETPQLQTGKHYYFQFNSYKVL